MTDFARDGFVVFDVDPRVSAWAAAAYDVGRAVAADPAMQAKWLRHGATWFVGVDALPNGADGAIGGTALAGPWADIVDPPATWHAAQLSVVYAGYPRQDAGERDGAHRFRKTRAAAHVDGLHLENGRRIVREPHAFILGVPLNYAQACPLVVWRNSHVQMRAALADAIPQGDPRGADVTDIYKAARARVFDTCTRVDVQMKPGQAVLVDRFALHGVAPFEDDGTLPDEGRMVAYFRPECGDPADWLRI